MGLGVIVGIGMVVLIGAPLVLDFGALSSRAGSSQTDWMTIRESVPLVVGGEGLVLWLMGAKSKWLAGDVPAARYNHYLELIISVMLET